MATFRFNWSGVRRLIGETIREIGILVLVFAPLELSFSDAPEPQDLIAIGIAAALSLIAAGILLDVKE